jgi:hypothetical protein
MPSFYNPESSAAGVAAAGIDPSAAIRVDPRIRAGRASGAEGPAHVLEQLHNHPHVPCGGGGGGGGGEAADEAARRRGGEPNACLNQSSRLHCQQADGSKANTNGIAAAGMDPSVMINP